MTSIDVDDYKEFAAKLRDAEKVIKNEIRKELRTLGKEFGEEVLLAGADEQPQGGGLAAWIVGTAKVNVSITLTRMELALGVKSGDLIRRLDSKGLLRHPVWADPTKTRKEWSWVNQTKGITKGAWTDAFLARKDEMVAAMGTAMENALRRLT